MSTLAKRRWANPTNDRCSTEIATNTLFTLEVFADRLAHSLRSPLGVLRGLISDSQNGFPLDESGLKDASTAIDRLLRVVDDIVSIAITRRPTNGMFCLSDILDALGTPLCSPIVVVDTPNVAEASYSMDLSLAQHAVRCVDNFLGSCLVGSTGQRRPERNAIIEREGSRIRWSLITKEIAALERYASCERLSHVADLVNSPLALGLLAAESAMVLNGMSSAARVLECGEMQLELVFTPVASQAVSPKKEPKR